MARIPYGAPKKGGSANRSWRDGYIKENPRKHWKKSCSACMYYCEDDHSYLVSPVYPPVDGYDYWENVIVFRFLRNLLKDIKIKIV